MECIDPNTAVEFVEGALDDATAAAVEHHMARCSECRMLIAELAKSGTLAMGYGATEPTPGGSDSDAARASTALAALTPSTPGMIPGRRSGFHLAQGADVGRYVILKPLGAGGMGVVYAAYDPKLDRKVALKFIRGRTARGLGDEDARARLVREAQSIARLNHPNVVAVYDVGTFEEQIYIAMEFIDGVTLTEWTRWRQRGWREVVALFIEAAKGLAAAHEAGVVHRDFKPDNVIVGTDGRVRVMDFGLARADAQPMEAAELAAAVRERSSTADGTADGQLTRTGAILGTPRYMAPEQYAGAIADARSDQFSFCIALYEALFGVHPLRSGTAVRLMKQPLEAELLPAPEGIEVPAWLRACVLRGLDPDPARRHASIAAVIAALQVNARPPSAAARWPIAMAGLAVLGVAVFAYSRVSSEAAARERAERDGEERDRVARDEIERLRGDTGTLERRLEEETAARDDRIRKLEEELAKKDAEMALLGVLQEKKEIRASPVPTAPPYAEALDKRVVQKRLQRHHRSIVRCYVDGMAGNPTLGGWAYAEFVIDAEGNVVWVRVKGLGDKDVADCIRGVIRQARFPRSEVPTHANYPFYFRLRGRSTAIEVQPGETAENTVEVTEDLLGILCDPYDPLCGLE